MDKLFFTALISIFIIFVFSLPSHSSIKGGVDYSVPIDYSQLNEEQIKGNADFFYNSAINSKELNNDMTSALNLYTILANINPENISYPLKLGKLYENIGKNRYAKGNYYRAAGLCPTCPEPYYYLGNYYYEKEQYKKALKFFQKAVDNGYSSDYATLCKIGDIYQKFGDSKNAVKYLQSATEMSQTEELSEKLNQIKNADSSNKEYYKK